MNAIPFLVSQITEDYSKTAIKLQQATHEQWSVDWQNLTLVCRHGISLSPPACARKSVANLREYATARHAKPKR